MDNAANFYIKYDRHPSFSSGEVETDQPTDLIVQKFETILFTKKGEVLGYPDFGVDMEGQLWQTRFSADKIRSDIADQLARYVPELQQNMYELSVYIVPGTVRDIGVVELKVNDATVTAAFI